jgi:hypothetical protein
LSEAETADDGPLLDLDPALDLVALEDDSAPGEEDFGPREAPAATDLGMDESSLPEGDEADGADDAPVLVDEGLLPELDRDDGPEAPLPQSFGSLPLVDEVGLPRAARPWAVRRLGPSRERAFALAALGGVVVAGSSDLLWLDRGSDSVVRIALDGTRITSVALLGEERQIALCVTAFGRLLRRSRTTSEVDRLPDWRRIAENGGGAESLELTALEGEPRSVIGRLTSGRLVKSDDLGATFYPLDTSVTAFSLSPQGDPLAALTRDGAELALSRDGGQSFVRLPLIGAARDIASGEAPFVSTLEGTVIVAEPSRGVAVSLDGGTSFAAVPGTISVSAVALGRLGGTLCAFVALHHEVSDTTDIAIIDLAAAEATVIASITGEGETDESDTAGTARAERLVWDGTRLVAAGDVGLVCIEPPGGEP